MSNRKKNIPIYITLIILAVAFLAPIGIVLLNSFKGKLYISTSPFSFINGENFAGIENYVNGIEKTGFLSAFGWSLFITILSWLKLSGNYKKQE